MTPRKKPQLTSDEIARAFTPELTAKYGPIVSPAQFAELFGLSRKTILEWIRKGRLDGALRKRGKHNLIWRDLGIDLIFNGKEWTHES
jgi:hypothetical protein